MLFRLVVQGFRMRTKVSLQRPTAARQQILDLNSTDKFQTDDLVDTELNPSINRLNLTTNINCSDQLL